MILGRMVNLFIRLTLCSVLLYMLLLLFLLLIKGYQIGGNTDNPTRV